MSRRKLTENYIVTNLRNEIKELKAKVDRREKALKQCRASMKEALRCHKNEWGEETMNCVFSMEIDIENINKALQDKEQREEDKG